MKQFFTTISLFLFGFIHLLQGQDFFICTSASELRKLSVPNCAAPLRATLPYSMNDITMHPDGKLYGIRGSGALFVSDTTTGLSSLVATLSSPGSFVALTANARGIIYAASNDGRLYSFNPVTLVSTYLGTISVNGVAVVVGGDLTYYQGEMYVATQTSMVKVNLANPANSTLYMDFNISPYTIFGIVTYVSCGQIKTYALTSTLGRVYEVDWTNRVLNFVCQSNLTIYGGASVYEFYASLSAPDTTRIVNNTCNAAQAGVTTRVLRNRAGCDSVVVTQTNYVRADTTRFISLTCNLAQVRSDTVRLVNYRGCDSLVVTQRNYVRADTTRFISLTCNPAQVRSDTVRLINFRGCDSLVVRQTNFSPPDTTRRTVLTCNTAQVGITTRNFTNIRGCDSVVITQTNFSPPDTTRRTALTCNAAQAGITTRLLTNIRGCDSVVIIQTNFSPPDTTRRTATTCNPAQAGITTRTLTNIRGCDSVVITQTNFSPPDTTRRTATTCNPAQAGITTRLLTNIRGCDSVVITQTNFVRGDTIRTTARTCDPTQVRTDTTRLTNIRGCDSLVIRQIQLNAAPTATFPTRTSYCLGDSIAALNTNPQSNWTYAWTATPATGIFPNATAAAPGVKPAAGTYKFVAKMTSDLGCVRSDSFNLTVVGATLVVSADTTICANTTATLNAVGTATDGIGTYLWSNGSTKQSITISDTATVQRTNTHTVAYSFGQGCVITKTVRVTIKPSAGLMLTSNRSVGQLIDQGDVVTLNAVVAGAAGNLSYTWLQNTVVVGNTPTISTKVIEADAQNRAFFTINVASTASCVNSGAGLTFRVRFPRYEIPNAFTPNADTLNDAFSLVFGGGRYSLDSTLTRPRLHKGNIQLQSMQIYDRFGQVVYQETNVSTLNAATYKGWNGKRDNTGDTVPSDVYVYIIRILMPDGTIQKETGEVNLIR